MLVKQCLLLGALAINAASALMFDPDWPLALVLKRQDDMSDTEYNCHDNCGQAIKAGRGTDPCGDDTFRHDYAACLQCAGPDNEDIWKYYAGSLTSVAEGCGLSTTPATGTQAAASAAITATSAASASTGTGAVVSASATATTSASAEPSGASSASAAASTAASASGSAAALSTAAAATASSTASSTAAAASASATGAAASSASVGRVSMIGWLSTLGYFVFGF